MKLINLTPHEIVVENAGSRVVVPSSGNCRVAVKQKADGQIRVNAVPPIFVPIFNNAYGDIEGLPERQDDTFYIVSLIVLNALGSKQEHRSDVLAPDTGKTAIRDQDGKIAAVTQFVRN